MMVSTQRVWQCIDIRK